MSNASFLRRVFGGIWRTITHIRNALANIVFLLFLVVVYFVYFGGGPEPLPEQAALVLNPMGSIVDQKAPVDPLQALLTEPSPADYEVRLRDVIEAIEIARDDESINALVMELEYLVHAGISRTQEIVAALESFRETGKPIVAVGDFYTQDQYLLASYADEVIGHPMGGVAIEGYGMYPQYFAEALEKLSVTMHVFRAGQYKSAVEPFLRNDMSPEEKVAAKQWLDDLWGRYTATVEANRELAEGAVDAYVNGFAQRMVDGDGDSARDALEAGLIDQLLTRAQADDYLAELVGERDEEGLYQSVPFEQYLHRKRGLELIDSSSPRIAVITAQGNILPGDQPPGTVGSDSLARQIRAATANDGVKAIVLRVTSPGGSMFASEVIREHVLLARAAGKPVVVSMGSMAASGGYYIAAAADEIWATPTTITGSIGVFAAFPTVENLLQRAGVHTDGVGTTSLAGSLRLDRGLNPQLSQALAAGVENSYRKFLDIVADGRDMTLEEVRHAAQGRVWSASDALSLGLVDFLGNLDDAIGAAAARADLVNYEIEYIEEPLSPGALFFQQLTERMGGLGVLSRGDSVAALMAMYQPVIAAVAVIENLQDPRHIYGLCLTCSSTH
ncbi:signal peptide peptidase SppA [Pseudohalioglobus lutimaris]|uniref:Signal peptide peptidase SppA n=1 Tax=Pseudohalioglobus lutimaris TaxID=1737061 RepID=A0A2N5X6C3_9GAMM|nr:signal peptide peptidase SppA [Pseudohalioglobus lutimaris]PLW70032.1 signal peptide peptidase SppA [Pseudohalioglobus lutimaris]